MVMSSSLLLCSYSYLSCARTHTHIHMHTPSDESAEEDEEVEDSSGEDSVLSGTFINDGTYTQHTPQVLFTVLYVLYAYIVCIMFCMLRVNELC